jgi:hypothetical protein
MNNSRKFKTIRYFMVALVVVFLVWQLFVYFQHRGQTGVVITAIPDDSSLTIDGSPARFGRVYLAQGSHKLVASRTYFDDDVKTVDTADITKNQTIYMLPAANSAAAKAYLLQNPDIQKKREAAGGVESERVQAVLLKKYPILSKLPHETLDYKIDYSLGSNQNLSLNITTYGIINGPADYTQYVQQTKAYRQEALDFLKQNGISPDTYPLSYTPNL